MCYGELQQSYCVGSISNSLPLPHPGSSQGEREQSTAQLLKMLYVTRTERISDLWEPLPAATSLPLDLFNWQISDPRTRNVTIQSTPYSNCLQCCEHTRLEINTNIKSVREFWMAERTILVQCEQMSNVSMQWSTSPLTSYSDNSCTVYCLSCVYKRHIIYLYIQWKQEQSDNLLQQQHKFWCFMRRKLLN